MKTKIFSEGELKYLDGRQTNSSRRHKHEIERKAKQLYERIRDDFEAFELLFPPVSYPIHQLKGIKLNLDPEDAKKVLMVLTDRHIRMCWGDYRYRDCLEEAKKKLAASKKESRREYRKVMSEAMRLYRKQKKSRRKQKLLTYPFESSKLSAGEIERQLNIMQNDMGNKVLETVYKLSSEPVDKNYALAPKTKLTAVSIANQLAYSVKYTSKFINKLTILGLLKETQFNDARPIFTLTKLGMRFSGKYLIYSSK